MRCVAENSSRLDGLLTVVVCHARPAAVSPSASLARIDSNLSDLTLPTLTEHDVRAIREFSQHWEIDFISLRWAGSAHTASCGRPGLELG